MYSYFSEKTGFDISQMSNPVFSEKKTICMKCQILVSRKNISKCCLLKILPRVLSVKLPLVLPKSGFIIGAVFLY